MTIIGEKYGIFKWILLSEIWDFVNNLCSMFMFRSNMKIPDFENMKIIKFQIIILIYCNQKCSWWLIRTPILRGSRPVIYIRPTQESNTIHIDINFCHFLKFHQFWRTFMAPKIFQEVYMMYDINYKEVEIDA